MSIEPPLKCVENDLIQCEIIEYDQLNYFEQRFSHWSKLNDYFDRRRGCSNDRYSTWIIFENNFQSKLIEKISHRFRFHRLIEENLLTKNDRMKLEIFENGSLIYFSMKIIFLHPQTDKINHKQISLIFKEKNLLIQFEEKKFDEKSDFDPLEILKSRLKKNRARIRSLEIDYLFYSLMEIFTDNAMFVLDHLGNQIDFIEKLLMKKFHFNERKTIERENVQFNFETLRSMFQIRHEMISLKILCRPLKEILIKLQKAQDQVSIHHCANSNLFRRHYRRKKRVKRIHLTAKYYFNRNSADFSHPSNLIDDQEQNLFHDYIFIYFRDLQDHFIQLNDRIDQYDDLLSSLITFDLIHSNGQTNQIMTFLSLVTISFVPFNFLISLFSLNFETMPMLKWHFAYFLLLCILFLLALIMFTSFKCKKWL